ncbi:MAG TPA: PVC-type heme-binding CxxCH protein, partial [Chthoniobacteraceae bacterium]
VDLWAAEPLLANPVALSFDEKGRCYVAETFRRRTSLPDIRSNTKWLVSSLSFHSVDDRIAFMKKTYPEGGDTKPDKAHLDLNGDGKFDWHDFEVESEQIALLEDTKGTGKADTTSVFADGFNSLPTGVGAGVLARDGHVWFTCVPDLWRFDAGSATASKRESLAHGFGVHFVSSGHDMHGVKMGPDGKIYWSIGDTGGHVTTREGKDIDATSMGAIFRINPDGSDMELYATGLRNPQSLAFNDFGDLFTGDNNADGGDKSRWLHIVEGGEYGWRSGWQYLPDLGAWNSEKLWELDTAKTAPYLLPPIGHVSHGPAGNAWYPGTGLPDEYRDHFFLADFPGGVRTFAIKPRGASYTLDNPGEILLDNSAKRMSQKLLWNLYPSDVGFGSDGGIYVLDWVYGWEKTGKGRIYRVHDPVVDQSPIVLETKRLLAEGMAGRSDEELTRLLAHVDQRIRTNAQFALATKGSSAIPILTRVASHPEGADAHHQLLARLHAIWGLGQIAQKSPEALKPVAALLTDADGEVRAQAAKVLGNAHRREDEPAFLALLNDPLPRPRFFAALALSKIADPAATPALVNYLRNNQDHDSFIRHPGVLGLVACASPEALAAAAKDDSVEVRTGVLLAMRRLRSSAVSTFLTDQDPILVREAARAIHDVPIDTAMPALAKLIAKPELPAPITRRTIDANYLLGTATNARAVAAVATADNADEPARIDALDALGRWATPSGLDRIVGTQRLMPEGRDPKAGAAAATDVVPKLLSAPQSAIRLAAAEAAARLSLTPAEPALLEAAMDENNSGAVRAAALRGLEAVNSKNLGQAVRAASSSKEKTLLQETRKLSAKLFPDEAAGHAKSVLDNGSIDEKQSAFQILGGLSSAESDKLISQWMDRLNAGAVPLPLELDLLEAAAKRSDAAVKQKLISYEAARKLDDRLSHWRECLEGGDAKGGRQIFQEKAEASCIRCHKINGTGGDVGPDLTHIASQHNREYLLTSVVLPNADIAPGFENVLLTLKNGSLVAGIVSSENGSEITLSPVDGSKKVTVKKSDIGERNRAPSPMPEGLGEVLGKRDLRNVVEYLSTLK